MLRSLVHLLDELKELDSTFSDLQSRLKSVQIELADIDNELRSKTETLDFSQEDSQLIKDKIDLYNSLSYKHNVQSVQALSEIQQKLEHELTEIESVENAVIQTEKEISKLHSELVKEATKISAKRKIESAALEKTIRAILMNLSMPDAELQIELSEQKEIGQHGIDGIDFLFKTNRGGQFLPLKKIASGGELSRLMLAILSTLSETKNLPSLVFDEIDTGVSGEVASKMATEFVRMGKNIQIIVITHLPQVAARGNVHLHVAKEIQSNKTVTLVKKLAKKDRITELAKMISGEKVTDAALANAENLLNIS
jgi:DNA repair protein RecN (Recombination protein N)